MSGNSCSDEPNANDFVKFARRIMAVPHSEIKAKLEAEKEAKRATKRSTARVSVVTSESR